MSAEADERPVRASQEELFHKNENFRANSIKQLTTDKHCYILFILRNGFLFFVLCSGTNNKHF